MRRGTPTMKCFHWGSATACLAIIGNALAQSALAPAGPRARTVAGLWWVMLAIAAAVFVVVVGLLLVAVLKRPSGGASPAPWSTLFVALGGAIIPAVILVGLLVYSLAASAGLAKPKGEPLVVQVVGHQWWWEVNYPGSGVSTANEIHIPVGVPVRLELSSADVIHSFWVPSLSGKQDLIPGRTNSFWIEADEAGIYRGSCAEFCGVQHAKMGITVVADRRDLFRSWLEREGEPAPQPQAELTRRGQQVFLSSACVYCHTVQGTNASGTIAPDLTHLASRMTLGAGSVTNSRGNLAGWIVNSQSIKPGNRMPPMVLDPGDLQALLAYLQTLD